MNSKGSGGRLEGFFTGKGFYIVLILCAAVIGVSAWMLAAGNKTMLEKAEEADIMPEMHRVETVVIPPPQEVQPVINTEETPKAEAAEAASSSEEEIREESVEVWMEESPAESVEESYIWPVEGEIERFHDTETLNYDSTMKDWRTHDGIDILSPLGSPVKAAHSGLVKSVEKDDLYGTTVTVDQGDGTISVYSNLEETSTVSAGDFLENGDIIGAVGATAICESTQCSHLHYAVRVNGESRDPMEFLPA